MVRDGMYARYNGSEYRYEEDGDGNGFIYTHDKDLTDSTFFDDEGDGVFEKQVTADELDSVYDVRTIATVRGVDVDFIREDEGKARLGTSDPFIAKELGMARADKYYYEGVFPADKVMFREIVTELSGPKKKKAGIAGHFFNT